MWPAAALSTIQVQRWPTSQFCWLGGSSGSHGPSGASMPASPSELVPSSPLPPQAASHANGRIAANSRCFIGAERTLPRDDGHLSDDAADDRVLRDRLRA